MLKVATILFLFVSLTTKGQRLDDSVSKIDTTINSTNQDQKAFFNKYDSIQQQAKISRVLDSIKILSWGDTLRQKVNIKSFSDSLQLFRRKDSLRRLGESARKLTRFQEKQLKKIHSKRSQLLGEVNDNQKELHEKLTGGYDSWQKNAREKFNLDSMGLKLPGANLNKVQGLNLPAQNLNIPNASLPGTANFPKIPVLETSNFTNLNLSGDLKRIGGNWSLPSMGQLNQLDKTIPSLSQFKDLSNQMKGYQSMFKDPSATAENAMKQIGDVKSLSKELDQAANLQKQNEALQLAKKMKNDEAMKAEAKKMAEKEAINHFKGQEQALQNSMNLMSKYKKKYSSLKSLSDIKKNDWLPHNGLKGQSFRERFRLGIHTGLQQRKDTLILDFYPNASYKFTGRLEAGLGAIYRVRAMTNTYTLNQDKSTWGLASFVILRTFKKTYFRVEVDGNSYLRPGTLENPSTHDWRWTFLAGVQSNYKINKSFTGNVQMLFNFDNSLKDKFPEAMTVRVGVQYKLAGKKVNSKR